MGEGRTFLEDWLSRNAGNYIGEERKFLIPHDRSLESFTLSLVLSFTESLIY
jgi:hypothetical protein